MKAANRIFKREVMNPKEKDELREAIGKEFPYTWLDPLLIGKDVPELPWNCPEIEWYTRQLKERILKAIEAFEHPQPLDAGEEDRYFEALKWFKEGIKSVSAPEDYFEDGIAADFYDAYKNNFKS